MSRRYFLETQRLLFSHWSADDGELARQLWGEEAVTRYISKEGRFTPAEIAQRLADEIASRQQSGVQYWPVFERASGDLAGCCGLHPYDMEQKIYELGFHFRSTFWGKGLATEAARTVLAYAFDELSVTGLYAGHNPENAASRAVLLKLGFEFTGEEFYAPTGLFHPVYGLAAHKYHEQPLEKPD